VTVIVEVPLLPAVTLTFVAESANVLLPELVDDDPTVTVRLPADAA
jgi:hypothetical protein